MGGWGGRETQVGGDIYIYIYVCINILRADSHC